MPSRQAPTIRVYFDGTEQKSVRAMKVQRSAGGHRLDHCVVRQDLAKMNPPHRIMDFGVEQAAKVKCKITGQLPDGGDEFVYFDGILTQTRVVIDGGDEVLEYVGQLAEYLFGVPIIGQYVGTPEGDYTPIDAPLVFNPEIDGSTFGNKDTAVTIEDFPPLSPPAFLDPEALRSNASRQVYGVDPLPSGKAADPAQLWKLSEAVEYLMFAGNTENDQTIENAGDTAMVVDDEKDLVRDIRLPQGLYLPAALDHLLEPLGYNWFVAADLDGKGRTIQVFKRGTGTDQVAVSLQRPGDSLSTDVTDQGSDAARLDVNYDLGSLYNQIVGLGDYVEIESTFTLSPAWNDSEDSTILQIHLLNRKNKGFDQSPFRDVGRRYVLNEAGDYNQRRSGLDTFDFVSFLSDPVLDDNPDAALPKRRKFHPALTLGADLRPIGNPQGCTIEYYEPILGGQSGWKLISGGVSILPTECGIYLNSDELPEWVYRIYATTKAPPQVRITATVRFDLRLRGKAEKQDTSPNGLTHELVLDWAHLFRYRQVDSTSQYSGDIQSGNLSALQDDDTEAIQSYCEQIRDAWDMLAINGAITIEGVDDFRADPPYEIGQSVTAVHGRNISLNARASGDGRGEAFPQIVGITYDFQRQTTTLQLERYREKVRFLKEAHGEITEIGPQAR
ncbi:MAG TPA: hypothetical protein VGY55_11780 [Pirellulales bacterium]|jgi:hypothetical protein|nr:hypothetical protein [Pirellulales bacterium]